MMIPDSHQRTLIFSETKGGKEYLILFVLGRLKYSAVFGKKQQIVAERHITSL